jgi:hypothetical protein
MAKKRTAKKARAAKAATKGGPPPGGAGVQGSNTPQKNATDSASQNLLQLAAEFDKEILEAVRLMSPSVVQIYVDKDEKRLPFDEMLEVGFNDEKRAIAHLVWIGHIMRSGVKSLARWATSDHVPTVQKGAQRVLADVIKLLETERLVKLTRAVGKKDDAFATRWRELTKRGRGNTEFAAVQLFGMELMQHLDRTLARVAESYPSTLENEPKHIQSLAKLVHVVVDSHEPGTELLTTYVVRSTKFFLLHSLAFAGLWKKIFWPLAKEIWPEFAREFEHWRGPRQSGRPLSDRKRPVDEKTDFSPARFESEIRHAFEDSVLFHRAWEGE